MPNKTITLHESATKVVSNMHDRVATIGRVYGENSPEHAKAAASLARVLSQVMLSGFGNAEISRDGDLSLFVTEGAFVYAVIFHRDPGATDRILAEHGMTRETAPDYVLAQYDVAGTWSMHS